MQLPQQFAPFDYDLLRSKCPSHTSVLSFSHSNQTYIEVFHQNLMEEYLIREQTSPTAAQLQPEDPSNKLFVLPTASTAPHRHVSTRYGIEFQSKVALFAKQRVSCHGEASIQALPKEKLFKKLVSFLQASIRDSAVVESLLKNFKELELKMGLTVRSSQKSLTSEHSQDLQSENSEQISKSSSSGNGQNLATLSKSSSPNKQNGGSLPKLKKAKTSMMSKCNRISLVDAINFTELQKFKQNKEFEIAESSQSIETNSVNQFRSKGDLTSDPSEVQSQESSLHSLKMQLKLSKPQKNNKKISIMIVDDFSSSGSDFFSEQEIISLKELSLAELALSESLLDTYFEVYSPFLVNLALCLLYKCLARGQVSLKEQNVGWLMGVATLVAYKIYYDEPIEGLMDYFADTMSMQVGNLAKLERWFLSSVNYEVVVSSQQYQSMMFSLMGHKDNSERM